MKALFIGDPHVTADSLEECGRLVDYAVTIAEEEKVDYVIYAGDEFNTHSILNLYVIDFWSKNFKKHHCPVYALVGNHDRPGNGADSITALDVYKSHVNVIDTFLIKDNILFVGYMSDSQAFIDLCNSHPECSTVICHATFSGAQYENGFYAKDGIDAAVLPQKHIISGHIHAPSEFGKVWYPGAPRWRTAADANTERALWVIAFDNQGIPIARKSFDTSKVCRSIVSFKDTPDNPADISNVSPLASVIVDIHGPMDYVNQRKEELKDKGVRIRTYPDRGTATSIKESEGMSVSFNKYLNRFSPKRGTSKDKLLKLAISRIGWAHE